MMHNPFYCPQNIYFIILSSSVQTIRTFFHNYVLNLNIPLSRITLSSMNIVYPEDGPVGPKRVGQSNTSVQNLFCYVKCIAV